MMAARGVSGAGIWLPANDTQKIIRRGNWIWTSHRYPADSALATREDGATLELTFRGRALVLCLDTLTPPNNYGPPELGALEIAIDGTARPTVRPRGEANEIVLVRSAGVRDHGVTVVHRNEGSGAGCRIRGFRIVDEPSGELAFKISGEANRALIDVRAIVTRSGRPVRDMLVRNWLTGDCRIAGLAPGEDYELEVRAAGWTTFRAERLAVRDGEETVLAPIFLPRPHDMEQDAVTFPVPGHPVVRMPGATFRARFEAPNAEIRGLRLVRQYGPATVSRRCEFTEDKAAAFYYQREGTVAIPPDTPPGTYDLEIIMARGRGTEVLTSARSVAVVAAFPAEPVFVAWGHLDTWGQYQAEYVEQLAGIANLLAPDMVLVSNEANPAYAAGALRGLEMPFVINFGNHRGPEPGPWFGGPVGVVHFGSSFSVLNFGLAWDRGTAEADRLLAGPDTGTVRIVNAFEANAPVREFCDRHRIALIHYAHGPGPVVAAFGSTPTVRVGKSNSESFRVIRFKDGRPVAYAYRGHATAPIPFARGSRPPLSVQFQPANNGSHDRITATARNELEESFTGCRAIFIVPRGAYGAQGGRIERTCESDDGRYTVAFVRFDLPARGSGVVAVSPRRAAE